MSKMNLQQFVAWHVLNDPECTHAFTNNFERESQLWYFYVEIGNKTVIFNYRKYSGRVVLNGRAHVEIYLDRKNSPKCEYVYCDTVKELMEAISEV